MKDVLTSAGFEALARERVAEFAPEADLDVLGTSFDLVRVSNQLINDFETNVHRPLGWSWAGFRIMFVVAVAGPLEPARVARLAGVTRASISAVLNTLERDGFATRCASPATEGSSRSSSPSEGGRRWSRATAVSTRSRRRGWARSARRSCSGSTPPCAGCSSIGPECRQAETAEKIS